MKDIKIDDVCWCVEHSVYGNPNEPVNEPELLEFRISTISNGYYSGFGTDTYGVYTKPEKYVFKTREEGLEYIKGHRDEIIKESFQNHKKWFEEQLKNVRKPR
jgi:hypothetical protein